MMTRTDAAILLLTAAVAPVLSQPLFNKSTSLIQYTGAPENTLYTYTNGLFRSRDNGQTWAALHLLAPGLRQPVASHILLHPTNRRAVFVFTANPARVWKSTDGGDTWTDASAGLPQELSRFTDPAILTDRPDTMYLVGDTTVYVTRNGGAQWQRLSQVTRGSALGGQAGIGFGVAPSLPGRLYYWSGGRFARSDDDGATWRELTIPQEAQTSAILDAAVHPRNANELVMVVQYYNGGAAVSASTLVSTDGGLTFTKASPKGAVAVLEIDDAGNYHYTGCCRDYCRSTDRAQTWRCTALGTGPNDFAVDPANANTIYYSESTGVSRSTDGGATRPLLAGTVRPTLERPAEPLRLLTPPGSAASFALPLRTVEHNDWRIPFSIEGVPQWLTLSALSGNTPATVTATVDVPSLAPGTATAELILRSAQASAETRIPLSVIVAAATGGPVYSAAAVAGGGTNAAVTFSGPATEAQLSQDHIALAPNGDLYLALTRNTVHRMDPQGRLTHVAGTGATGSSGDGGPAVNAQLGFVNGVAAVGNDVYLSQTLPTSLRRISGGTITTVATQQQLSSAGSSGIGRLRPGPNGTVLWATGSSVFQYLPNVQRVERVINGADSASYTDVAPKPDATYYVLDTTANRVYLLRGSSRSVVAGTGIRGFAGDGGPATEALLDAPNAIALGGDGTLYIVDRGNLRVRAVGTDGIIRTVAGDGRSSGTPTGTLATQMPLPAPRDVVVSAGGDLFVADSQRVWKLARAQATPAVSPGGLLHQSTGLRVLSRGGYFSIYGMNFAAENTLASSVPWPTQLSGVEVRFNGSPVPLFFVGTGQINGQVPYGTPVGEVTATVTVNGVTTAPVTAEVRRAAPGILTYGTNRAVAVNPDGGINGAQGGAAAGETVVVYLTGVGPVEGQPETGAAAEASPLPRSLSNHRVTVGGQEATVGYLGLTPGQVGLAQANVVIPSLAPGDYPLVVTVDGVQSNSALLQVR